MTIEKLKALFAANSVPSSYYAFAGQGGGDTYVLEHTAAGWNLFYNDRGERFEEQSFSDEQSACNAMLAKVNSMLQHSQHRSIIDSQQS